MNFGYKPMAFGEHLLQVIRMEEGGLSRQKIREVWGIETPEELGQATRFQVAASDAIFWLIQSDIYDPDYLLECLNERYGREEILEEIDLIPAQIDQATDDPLGYAFEHPRPIRQTLMTIALIRHLGPGVAAKRAAEEYIGTIRQQLTQIAFPDNLQRVFDL